jgi:hypothetical protein
MKSHILLPVSFFDWCCVYHGDLLSSDLVTRSMEIEFSDQDAVPTNSSTSHSKALLANLLKGGGSTDLELQGRALAMNAALVYLLQASLVQSQC